MKQDKIPFIALVLLIACLQIKAQGMKDALGKSFLVGTALSDRQIINNGSLITSTVTRHFNSIVAENCMKPKSIQPEEGKFDWRKADRFVQFGAEHGMAIIGHCLVWHQQTGSWMFTDSEGKPVAKELLKERMRKHITAVVDRYKGKIKGWDVVNEAINDDGTYRDSPWYRILGAEYIELAFRYAHEADPDAELYYNDYSLANPAKRKAVCCLVRHLREVGCRIDAVGMQSHNGLGFPNMEEYEASIDSFAACGVKVMITELDLNVLPNPKGFGGAEVNQKFIYDEKMNPYKNGLPVEVETAVNKRWRQLFRIYRRHSHQIDRVCVWGVSDADSWMNDWPIKGRTAYSLLFDRNYQPKPVVNQIMGMFQ